MTKKEAIHILIQHAAKNCMGAGCGPGHSVPSHSESLKVSLAILKVWPEKHYPPNWFNMGLPNPEIYRQGKEESHEGILENENRCKQAV